LAYYERALQRAHRLRDASSAGEDRDVIRLAIPETVDEPCHNPSRADDERKQQFVQLFVAHERRIYAFILSLVPVWSDADDLLQETSAVLWSKLEEFRPGTDFVAWALRIARFEVLNYRRKKNRDRGLFRDDTDALLADEAAAFDRASDDRRDQLESCLAKLNERDRELIRLRYQSGGTTQQAAEGAGRSLKAVYKALNRIHQQLLACMKKGLSEKKQP